MNEQIRQNTAQQIVNTVKDVCGQDVNFIGSDGIILASTDPQRIHTFHEIGKQVITSKTTIEVSKEDSFPGTHSGVNIPITYNGTVIAAIGISGVPDQVRKYAYLAQRITLLILREQELDYHSNSQKNKLNYIIRSLIQADTIPSDYFTDFIKEYGINTEQLYCTVLVSLNLDYQPDNLSMTEQQIYQTFEAMGTNFYTFQYPNEYIAFLPESDCTSRLHLLEHLADSSQGILRIGIGSSCPIAGQSRSYQEAGLAVKSLPGNQSLAVYTELDLDLMLGNAPAPVQQLFLKKVLGQLSEEDRMLLTHYYEEDMSLSRTSQKLFLHKNTLQYKLDRIARLCGYNPRVFQDAVILYCALKTQALQ